MIPAHQRIRSAVQRRLAQWQDGRIYWLGVDPLPSEFGANVSIVKECQHGCLLWAYRNVLLHEFREPGFGINLVDDAESPYYHQVDFTSGPLAGSVGWELVIPCRFLEHLVQSCLNNLATYMRNEGIDPNSVSYRGRAWVARLRRSYSR